ncbi:hypothetical protein BJY01DRAFT_209274 [Aspergillus pseudoustus]|uniref:Uncharacterized protein n=1 Tax=Aspergillus pseudoustus TaxID=1810923 RepID=A0ABR4KH60_9EURO
MQCRTEGTVIIVTASVPRLRPLVILRKKPASSSRTMYNNAYSYERDASSRSRGRSRGQRYGTSVSIYADRSKDSSGAPTYPTPVLMRWNNDSGSESQDLIALEEEISASRSMQKFIHS